MMPVYLSRDDLTELKAELRLTEALSRDSAERLIAAYDGLAARNEVLWDVLHQAGKVIEKADDVGNDERKAEQETQKGNNRRTR